MFDDDAQIVLRSKRLRPRIVVTPFVMGENHTLCAFARSAIDATLQTAIGSSKWTFWHSPIGVAKGPVQVKKFRMFNGFCRLNLPGARRALF